MSLSYADKKGVEVKKTQSKFIKAYTEDDFLVGKQVCSTPVLEEVLVGAPVPMAQVDTGAELDEHDSFKSKDYDESLDGDSVDSGFREGHLWSKQPTSTVCNSSDGNSVEADTSTGSSSSSGSRDQVERILEMVFDKGDGGTQTIHFTERPLGLTFNEAMPIIVDRVDQHAAVLGVQVGWIVKEIDGHDITNMTYREAFNILSIGADRLMSSSDLIEFIFGDHNGGTVKLYAKRPVGLHVNLEGDPIRVYRVEGYAASRGVQVGWTLKGINNQDVSRLSTGEAAAHFKLGLSSLLGA